MILVEPFENPIPGAASLHQTRTRGPGSTTT
jgi:hypothetical protein